MYLVWHDRICALLRLLGRLARDARAHSLLDVLFVHPCADIPEANLPVTTRYAISLRGHRFARLNDAPFCVYCGWSLDLVDPPLCSIVPEKQRGRYAMSFTLDVLPPMNSARNTHWRVKGKKNKAIRERVAWAVCGRGKPPQPLKIVDALLVRYSVSRATVDPDNLAESFKPVMDELQVQGVIENDTIANFLNGQPTYEWVRVGKRADQGILVRLIEFS